MTETKIIAVNIIGSIIVTLGMLPVLAAGVKFGNTLVGVVALMAWIMGGIVALDTLTEKLDK